jgi:NADPH-dependent curcumin reductase CurA
MTDVGFRQQGKEGAMDHRHLAACGESRRFSINHHFEGSLPIRRRDAIDRERLEQSNRESADFENVGGAVLQAVLPLLNNYARVPVCGLVAQYNDVGPGDGIDRLAVTMREILSKSLTLRGFIYSEFVEQHFSEFLREVGALVADGRIASREDIVDGLERAPEAARWEELWQDPSASE